MVIIFPIDRDASELGSVDLHFFTPIVQLRTRLKRTPNKPGAAKARNPVPIRFCILTPPFCHIL